MSNNNNSQNTVVAAANNIRIAASVIADSRSTVRELSDARATLAFWTTELNKLGAANDMNNQTTTRTAPASVRYENEMPRQNAQPKVDNSKKGYVTNGSGNWYSSFDWATSETKTTWDQNRADRIAREERHAAERKARAAAHVYGFDPKTGIQHDAGAAAIYTINSAIVDQLSPAQRDVRLARAQKGIDIIDTYLMEQSADGSYPSIKELLNELLAQYCVENPGVAIPRYVLDLTNDQLKALKAMLDIEIQKVFDRKATFAELFYSIIRKGVAMEVKKEKIQKEIVRRG